ncbi:hemin uptake protein HemP [Aporhodopirellula aestuarii]|uniref:Hemin uptake protein HemP n=1 Tax=Aporhodopirellula aestuarii TaxID=2950107 RepID=A0ABT0UDM1_9BACT|nr:hemin uptake protein HemP [Aporhodopirellula aestuarii]MCM2375015.1 hemin uptake protein HemP [Aporhodopirellula aestuarii]
MESTPRTSEPTEPLPPAQSVASAGATVVESAVIETRVMGSVNGAAHPSGAAHPPHALKVVKFESLARCGDEIWIENEGQLYRLRKTRQGKLILTK